MNFEFPKSTWAFVGIIFGGAVILALTLSVTVPLNVMTLMAIWLFCAGAAGIAYLTTVRFHSPLCLTETDNFTTFNSRVEVIHDKEWDMDFGVVFVNGYNAAKKVLSKADVSTSGAATLLVTPSPFQIESFANGRFILVRGEPYQMNRYEARAFLDRPSVQAAIGNEVRSAVVYWLFVSKSLHADELPTNVATLGDLTATLREWHEQIAGSAKVFAEEFARDLTVVDRFRKSPIEKMSKERAWRPPKEDEKSDE